MPQPDSAVSQPDVDAAGAAASDQVRAGGTSADHAETLADGTVRHLDPRIIPLDRVMGWIFTAVVVVVLLIANGVLLVAGRGPRWLLVLLPFGSIAASVAVGWFSYVWPPIEYRHQSYVVDPNGIEIRRGVVWRRVISVPRSRVQHIDVSQGPVERAYGLATTRIYTAGTEYAKVDLRGLDHLLALRLRDRLLPKEAEDAV